MDILHEIVAHKREELASRKAAVPFDALREQAARRTAPPNFIAALRAVPIGLIAEAKRKSPSAGIIRDPFEPVAIAHAYAQAGAQAMSVLMDEKYFGGGEAHFKDVRAAVELPLLYKEFVVDPWQVWHAAALGASAVLLIVAALDRDALGALQTVCRDAGLTALVEVHQAIEMTAAVDAGAGVIGVNNRDLKTFQVSLETSLRLREAAPADCTLISESGIRTPDDVLRLKQAGFHGILVGQQLLEQPDLDRAVAVLMGKA